MQKFQKDKFQKRKQPSRIFFKRKRITSATTQKYSSLVKDRRRALLKSRFKEVKLLLPLKFVLIILGVVVSVVFILVFSNSNFNVMAVQILAPKEVSEKVSFVVNEYKGKNIYLIRESEVAQKIKESVPEIERVFVYKEFPSKIYVEAVQGSPVLILASLNETQLLDESGSNIGSFGGISKVELTEYEISALSGTLDLNSDYIKSRYVKDKSDAEKLLFDWSRVSEEEKLKIGNEIKQEGEQKIQTYFTSVNEIYSKSVYSSLPLIQSYYIDDIDQEDITKIISLIDNIKSRGINLNKNLLASKFSMDLYSEDNELIKVSLRREVEQQIKELDTVIYYGFFGQAKILDLRSDTYSITR